MWIAIGRKGTSVWFATLILVSMQSVAFGQSPDPRPTTPSVPKTKLEAFTGTTGVVSIKAYTKIGEVKGTGSVEVRAMSFRSAKTGQEQSGIAIEVKGGRAYSSPAISFIDYDEIQGLLDGIDYISKTQNDVTEHAFFEARYSTKGDFAVVVFNNESGQRRVSIESGTYGSHSVYFGLENLAEFKSLLVRARSVLDDPGGAKRAAAQRAEQEAARQAQERASRAAAEQRARETLLNPPTTTAPAPAQKAAPKAPAPSRPIPINPPKQ